MFTIYYSMKTRSLLEIKWLFSDWSLRLGEWFVGDTFLGFVVGIFTRIVLHRKIKFILIWCKSLRIQTKTNIDEVHDFRYWYQGFFIYFGHLFKKFQHFLKKLLGKCPFFLKLLFKHKLMNRFHWLNDIVYQLLASKRITSSFAISINNFELELACKRLLWLDGINIHIKVFKKM